jgi:hypothetical protein
LGFVAFGNLKIDTTFLNEYHQKRLKVERGDLCQQVDHF